MTIAKTKDGATYFQIEKHYYQSEEWEAAMMYLDDKEVPRHCHVTGEEYSLVGRIERYREGLYNTSSKKQLHNGNI